MLKIPDEWTLRLTHQIDRSTNHKHVGRIDRSTSLAAVVLVGLLSACRVIDEPTAPPKSLAKPLSVAVHPVRFESSHVRERRFSGIVRSRRASFLGFERGGQVASLAVEEGDRVRAGAPLARLDTRQLVVARRRLRAALAQARAQRGLSELTAKRLERLARESFTPKQRADEARFGRDAAVAKVDELEASIAQVAVDIDKSALRAPFDGTITDRLVDEGTVVSAGTPILRLLGDGGREAFIGVPVTELGRVALRSSQVVRVDERSTTAKVVGLIDDVDPRTRTVGVVLDLPGDFQASDGEVAHLILRRRESGRGAWIPLSALTQGLRGLWTVYTVRKNEGVPVVVREAVEILHIEVDRAFVRGTLEEDDRVIAAGLHRVVPGQQVLAVGTTEELKK